MTGPGETDGGHGPTHGSLDEGKALALEEPPVLYIEPPFSRNHPSVAKYPPEVTGAVMLESMKRRLGWTTFADKRVLDYGCGVRFARTIANLGLDFGLYHGVDIDGPAITWLTEHLPDSRFRFTHIDASNPLYREDGIAMHQIDRLAVGNDYDLACMFSVITHVQPDDAARIFRLVRQTVLHGGHLYFTAYLHPAIDRYREGDPKRPCLLSQYNPDFLFALVVAAGWQVRTVRRPSHYQQWAVTAQAV